MNTTCYLCGSQNYKTIFVEHEIPILQCLNCFHVYSSYEQVEHYDGYWRESEFDLNWWDLAHRKVYNHFIKKFLTKESGSILDVGCGLGFFVKTVMQQRPNWKVIGYEMSEVAVKFAREKNGLSNVFSGRVEDSQLSLASFDIITLWDVIEHIPKPQPLLHYLHSLLKPGGILFLQTPNFPIQLYKAKIKVLLKGMKEGVHYLEAKDHINDYTQTSLNFLAEQCNFQKPEYYLLPPILSVSGTHSLLGKISKLSYYHLTKLIWFLSFKTLFLNNTLFAVLRK